MSSSNPVVKTKVQTFERSGSSTSVSKRLSVTASRRSTTIESSTGARLVANKTTANGGASTTATTTGDGKCICEICTCGHHRCKHRPSTTNVAEANMAASSMSVSEEQQFSTSSMAAAVTSTQSSQSAQRAMEGKERRSSAGGQALVEPRKISDTALANLGSEVDVGQAQTSYMTSESKRESSAMSHSRESRSEMKTYEARKSSGSYEKHSGQFDT
ncbi:uncharacterized protein LOC131879653 [Tigriopus californicus]|uniref:uncharacterized protein LOC131879653 n=1 Tax=Tigriopus californicus TaxID=6832 RepID=UPI0027DA6AF4|nr:uncharacterized protein LOC131879653 [Tigriopus californicus]